VEPGFYDTGGAVPSHVRRAVLEDMKRARESLPPMDHRPRPPAPHVEAPDDDPGYFFNNPAHINPYAGSGTGGAAPARRRTWRSEAPQPVAEEPAEEFPLARLALAAAGRDSGGAPLERLEKWLRDRGETEASLAPERSEEPGSAERQQQAPPAAVLARSGGGRTGGAEERARESEAAEEGSTGGVGSGADLSRLGGM